MDWPRPASTSRIYILERSAGSMLKYAKGALIVLPLRRQILSLPSERAISLPRARPTAIFCQRRSHRMGTTENLEGAHVLWSCRRHMPRRSTFGEPLNHCPGTSSRPAGRGTRFRRASPGLQVFCYDTAVTVAEQTKISNAAHNLKVANLVNR